MTTAPLHTDRRNDSGKDYDLSGNISDMPLAKEKCDKQNAPVRKGNKCKLSARDRLRHTSEFNEVFKQKESYAGKFVVLYLRRENNISLRVGVIASKRTFRRAVDRNRAKRLMREAFRINRVAFADNIDVVLIARKRIISVALVDVEKDLLRLAKKAGILKR